MSANGMEMDEVSGNNVEMVSFPHKPVIHTPSDGPLCEACRKLDKTFFDVNCTGCQLLLNDDAITVSELFAIVRQWVPLTQRNVLMIIQRILQAGGHIADRDGLTDMTLLQYACKSGARGMGTADEACCAVSWLLEQGADLYIRCRWTNMAAIHYAAYFDVASVAAILLATTKGIDVDSPCSEFDGGTPLHIAAQNLAFDTAKVLLANGAYPFAADLNGKLPLDLVPDPCSFDPESEVAQLAEQMKSLLETAEPTADCIQLPTSTTVEERELEVSQSLQTAGLKIGDRVLVGGMKAGVLRFCGRAVFAPGLWAGVELDEPAGKNDGSVDGIFYFKCPPNYGIFAPLWKVSKFGSLSSRGSLQKLNYGKIEVSHVTAKVDTGLKSLRQNSAEDIVAGDRVLVAGKRTGIVHFVGSTEFAPGIWFGIELDKPVGKNDGSVNGQQYFTCKQNFGVFAPPSRVQKSSNAIRGSMTSLFGSTSGEMKLVEGLSVFCNGEMGIIRYIGHVDFAEGLWLGVELKTAKGKHDGFVQGRRYFTCKPGHGLLVRPSRVSVRGINGSQLLVD